MSDAITEYKKWKQEGEDLRVQAKEAMETRYHELLAEAVKIAEEYRVGFGEPLKHLHRSRRYATKLQPSRRRRRPPSNDRLRRTFPRFPSRHHWPRSQVLKLFAFRKRLATTKKKLDEAKASGKPTKAVEGRIYEIEDELRLAGQT